ncbi:hypothetical protein QE450_001357 [Paenibacillus sp. SORGH_AS306]|uniref:hypothetical protein n=1 Tax=unclassified Paenibacillus TaxID=185978 RepID=UPI0027845AB8|nr:MULTISPECIES: hypothetical protein [unclassified Paenibacillus]MDQ1233859.1 hypothetical protein [Paenibacillus sp. SORGH_AS_0306]MDR6110904.1 hypothetical protein [Paenibacillus sp. SORGH_AS_0338]
MNIHSAIQVIKSYEKRIIKCLLYGFVFGIYYSVLTDQRKVTESTGEGMSITLALPWSDYSYLLLSTCLKWSLFFAVVYIVWRIFKYRVLDSKVSSNDRNNEIR